MATAKTKMTDEERTALVQKLSDELEDFVAERSIEARKNKREDTRSFSEMLEELKSHPAFLQEVDLSKPLSPDVEALIQLKYETEDPTARATSYKEDGNEQFKIKKYHIAIDNYTEAIKSNCPDKLLNAVLYTNRAAAQYYLGNYRSSFNDCIFARKFKPDHFKAILRGAECCFKMNKFDDTIRWCEHGLLIENENKVLLDWRLNSEKEKRIKERDERKIAAQERKEELEEKKLIDLIKSKGVNLATMKVSDDSKLNQSLLTNVESQNPTKAKVHIDSAGVLHWPVLFFYPEHSETDFVSAFSENDRFVDHINTMFGPDTEPAPWDEDRKYKPKDLEIVFENRDESKLYVIPLKYTLLEALQQEKYTVYGGTPGFIVVVKGSKYRNDFFERYKHK